MLAYINKKGDRVQVNVSHHAKERFQKRWSVCRPTTELGDVDKKIEELFEKAVRVVNFNRYEKERLKKYRGGTVFLRNNEFTFVIQGNTVVTIEISAKPLRNHN